MTPRQQRFVEEYVVDLNAHQAALRAGYARHSARQTVTRLLQRPEVADAIRAATAARTERTRITADRVLLELARIAFAEIGRLADWGPEGMTLKPRQDVAEDDAAAVAEIAAGKDGAPTRIKLHDKQRALDGLARHLGLYGRTAGWLVKSPDARIEAANRAREILAQRIEALSRSAAEERSRD